MLCYLIGVLTLCFACLWAGLSTTRIFDLGPVNIEKTLLDKSRGGGRGASEVKVNILLDFSASE